MFEKIGRFAEALATCAGQSRRVFLGQLGKGALGAAGVVGGLLLFQGEAFASPCTGGCKYSCPNNKHLTVVTGCATDCTCPQTIRREGNTCALVHFGCAPK